MTVRLRLQRRGAKKNPFFRIVAADKRKPRDGRFIENLGTYNPVTDPPELRINEERVDYWMQQGAQPSDTVRSLIRKLKNGEFGVNLAEEGADAAARAAKAEARRKAKEEARKKAAEEAEANREEAEEEAKAEEEEAADDSDDASDDADADSEEASDDSDDSDDTDGDDKDE